MQKWQGWLTQRGVAFLYIFIPLFLRGGEWLKANSVQRYGGGLHEGVGGLHERVRYMYKIVFLSTGQNVAVIALLLNANKYTIPALNLPNSTLN